MEITYATDVKEEISNFFDEILSCEVQIPLVGVII